MGQILNQKLVVYFNLVKKIDHTDGIKDFERWLKSPWVNTNQKLVDLFKAIVRYAPEFNHKNLNKTYLSKKIFKTDKLGQLNNHITLLKKQFEDYLAFHEFRNDEFARKKMLARHYLKRGELEKGAKIIEQEIENLESKTAIKATDYLEIAMLSNTLLEEPSGKFLKDPNCTLYNKFEENLDIFYAFETASRLADRKQRKRAFKNETGSNNQKRDFIAQLKVADRVPAVKMYLKAVVGKPQEFLEFKHELIDLAKSLPKRDHRYLLKYLINDVFQLRFSGQTGLEPTIFELYRYGFENDLMLIDGKITCSAYCNAIGFSNLSGHFDHSTHWIEKYTTCLAKDIQKDAKLLMESHRLYCQGNFDKCIEQLKDKQFTTILLKRQQRLILVRAYFERYVQDKEFKSTLSSYIKAFEVWLKREAVLSENRKIPYKRFLSYTQQIIHQRSTTDLSDTNRLSEILNQIERENEVFLKPWLVDQVKELIRKDG